MRLMIASLLIPVEGSFVDAAPSAVARAAPGTASGRSASNSSRSSWPSPSTSAASIIAFTSSFVTVLPLPVLLFIATSNSSSSSLPSPSVSNALMASSTIATLISAALVALLPYAETNQEQNCDFVRPFFSACEGVLVSRLISTNIFTACAAPTSWTLICMKFSGLSSALMAMMDRNATVNSRI